MRTGLGRGVVGLCSGVVLCAQLYGGLHGDLGVLGEAVAAVRGRRAVVAGFSRGVSIRRLRLQLDHPVSARTKGKQEKNKEHLSNTKAPCNSRLCVEFPAISIYISTTGNDTEELGKSWHV